MSKLKYHQELPRSHEQEPQPLDCHTPKINWTVSDTFPDMLYNSGNTKIVDVIS